MSRHPVQASGRTDEGGGVVVVPLDEELVRIRRGLHGKAEEGQDHAGPLHLAQSCRRTNAEWTGQRGTGSDGIQDGRDHEGVEHPDGRREGNSRRPGRLVELLDLLPLGRDRHLPQEEEGGQPHAVDQAGVRQQLGSRGHRHAAQNAAAAAAAARGSIPRRPAEGAGEAEDADEGGAHGRDGRPVPDREGVGLADQREGDDGRGRDGREAGDGQDVRPGEDGRLDRRGGRGDGCGQGRQGHGRRRHRHFSGTTCAAARWRHRTIERIRPLAAETMHRILGRRRDREGVRGGARRRRREEQEEGGRSVHHLACVPFRRFWHVTKITHVRTNTDISIGGTLFTYKSTHMYVHQVTYCFIRNPEIEVKNAPCFVRVLLSSPRRSFSAGTTHQSGRGRVDPPATLPREIQHITVLYI